MLDRAPDAGGLAGWVALLDGGMQRETVVLGFADSREFVNNTAQAAAMFTANSELNEWSDDVFRLYQATLDRAPDLDGFYTWANLLSSGLDYLEGVGGFVRSQEFQNVYGSLGDTEFVELLYDNALDCEADVGGLQSWLDALGAGATREDVVKGFAQSLEFVTATNPTVVDYVRAFGFDDTLSGGSGEDTLEGGLYADVFLFEKDVETDITRVVDFELRDVLSFVNYDFETRQDVLDQFVQVGADAVLDLDNLQVILEGTALTDFTEDQFMIDIA